MLEAPRGAELLTTMADAIRLAADRETSLTAVLPAEQQGPRKAYVDALTGAARLMAEFAKAAQQGAREVRGVRGRLGLWLRDLAARLLR